MFPAYALATPTDVLHLRLLAPQLRPLLRICFANGLVLRS